MCIGLDDWKVSASCVYCGGVLDQVNGCTPSTTLALAVVSCGKCGREFELTARLTERRRATRVQRQKAVA